MIHITYYVMGYKRSVHPASTNVEFSGASNFLFHELKVSNVQPPNSSSNAEASSVNKPQLIAGKSASDKRRLYLIGLRYILKMVWYDHNTHSENVIWEIFDGYGVFLDSHLLSLVL